MVDGSTRPKWVGDPDTFEAALDDLEAEGCLLLVLEAGDDDGAADAGCRRMLGDDDHADRKRLFVGTGSAIQQSPSAHRTEDDQRSVVYRSDERSAAAAPASTSDSRSRTGQANAAALGDAMEAELRALAPVDGYDPGQLRVCVDGLATLLDDEDVRTVVQFVETLGTAVRDRTGIAHVHVDRHVPPLAVEALFPQFDAVVEVADGTDPRQRWHLPEESLSTEWLEL